MVSDMDVKSKTNRAFLGVTVSTETSKIIDKAAQKLLSHAQNDSSRRKNPNRSAAVEALIDAGAAMFFAEYS